METKKYSVVYMDPDSLIPYVNNPRNNDQAVDAVASSIINFGFKSPIVVDANYEVVNGHTRLKAAKKLGLEEVPVIVADELTEDQVRAFRLADNKVAELAEWDMDMLTAELSFINMDMEPFGFDLSFDDDIQDEVAEDEDFDDTLPEEPTSKLGDIYQLGRHRLMCGDSTTQEALQALTGGSSLTYI